MKKMPLYPESLVPLTGAELKSLGEEYLSGTRIQRKTDRPFFVDKMPNNFIHIGLIHLILPNAKIIDARRHPMACCFTRTKATAFRAADRVTPTASPTSAATTPIMWTSWPTSIACCRGACIA